MLKIVGTTLAFITLAAPALAEWPAESAAMGARDHPAVLQHYGGEIRNPPLSAYVSAIGGQMVAVSDRAGELWRFTVLDSPEVNAFALPGGYVYVTRGLLALARNESELAAVLAHEVTHVVAAHIEARQAAEQDALVEGALAALVTGLFGGGENRLGDAVRSGVETVFSQIGTYSKAQEFEADAGGIALLEAAGYRPAAQADMLASMANFAAYKAAQAGRDYDATSAPFFANHPAPAERQLRALALGGTDEGRQGVEAYLAAIDGMIYGQNPRAGLVLGQRFVHPALGFAFEAAQGLRIENAAQQINILGPNGATLILSGGQDIGDLELSLQRWAARIPPQERLGGGLRGVRRLEINGLAAATGTLNLRKRGQRHSLRLTVIRFGDGLIRFASTVQPGDETMADLHWQTVRSFGPLTAHDQAVRATYILIHQMQAGETAEGLIAAQGVQGFTESEFNLLNGLADGETPRLGQWVKLVSY
jgi:predicted Zn-dependent protease